MKCSRAFVFLLLTAATAACTDAATVLSPTTAPAGAAEFVTLVNRHRESVGCAPLAWHARAAEVALRHSRDMASRDFFGHETPEGLSPFDRLTEAGIGFVAAGENIAAGQPDARTVFRAWLASPGHRSNIENCAFTHHGFGEARKHWTHVFLTPP